MNTATVNAVAGETVSPAAKTYANDGSFDSVKDMLHKMAYRFTRRVEALGIPMTQEDVFQELCLSYVQAKKTWKPEGGARFVTYCVYAAQNNFNLAVKKMARERVEMGMTPIEDYKRGDPDCSDPLEWLNTSASDESMSPDYRLLRAGAMSTASEGLSLMGTKFIHQVCKLELGGGNSSGQTLREIASKLGISGDELRRLKIEIRERFGVTWH